MFAFAVHNARTGKLWLVRDRLGIKPLYYALERQRLVFASELTALLQHPSVERTVDPDAIAAYLYYQYVPTPHSIYRGIRKLEPGTYLEIDVRGGTVTQHRYWDLPVAVHRRPEAELREELDALLSEAIDLHGRSDVPFGAFLSGGLDSSLVVGFMRDRIGPVRAYSIGFAEEAYSELPWAQRAAADLGVDFIPGVASSQMALEMIPQLARHFGEPFGDSSAVPTWLVSRHAAADVKMVLSGDGGDELFGGYELYRLAKARPLAAQLPGVPGLMKFLSRWSPGAARRQAAYWHSLSSQELYDHCRRILPLEQVDRLMIAPMGFVPERLPILGGADDPTLPMQALDVRTYMLDDILTKVDRMSMANSLEVRVPLLDHKVVEFAFSLPPEMRLRRTSQGLVGKYLLKAIASKWFAPDFLHRRKMGFGIPVTEWLLGPLAGMVRERLDDWPSGLYDLVRHDRVMDIVNAFYRDRGASVPSSQIWVMLMLKVWWDEVHVRSAR